MIKREELKKGDLVMVVSNSSSTRITEDECRVLSIGPKFITVARIYNGGETHGVPMKFHNDEQMFEKDCLSRKLFLGNYEAWRQYKQEKDECTNLYRELERKLSVELGLDKLKTIKAIIDGESVHDTICEIYLNQLMKDCPTKD